MQITVINKSEIPDLQIISAIRAINRQINEDFEPYWHKSAVLTLHGSTAARSLLSPRDLRGDAVIYLTEYDDSVDALGYHDITASGVPYSVVYTNMLPESWTVTLSHEALEMLVDPMTAMFAQGKHPSENRTVYYWYEVCDAVQADTYTIDGIEVSNFILPLYFTERDEIGAMTNFLGLKLTSLGLRPGGYVGFFDPELQNHDTVFADRYARKRSEIKSRSKYRRGTRYTKKAI
jgi:hypothetical protein